MFMGSQNFPVSWGRNFVVSVIRIIFIDIKQMIYSHSWGYKFKSHRHWFPTNNDDSTVFDVHIICKMATSSCF